MSKQKKPVNISEGYSAFQIMDIKFPEPKWAIPGILPQGLNILAGKPKRGKSILALNIGIPVANGGKALGNIEVQKGTVIYLALEDTYRRLQDRLEKMLRYEGPAPDNFYLYTMPFPRMGEGGKKALTERLQLYPDCRLVIIDTLQKFRPISNKSGNAYQEDYQAISGLKELSDELNISFLIIHHLRKTESEDRFDDISGTFGISGAADGLLLLIRDAGDFIGELRVTGRDMESNEYAMKFNPDILTWNILGDASELQSTDKKQILFDTIKNHGEPMSPKEIAEKSGIYDGYVKRMLPYLVKEGAVIKVSRGVYRYNDV
jgi:replicative DNA helicase